MSFCHEISSICKRTKSQIDPELSKNSKFLSFLMESLFIFREISFKFQHHQLKKTLQGFASKHFRMTPMESKIFNFHSVQLMNFLSRFGGRMSANVQQRLKSESIRFLKDYLLTSVGKWLKIDCEKSKVGLF